MILTSSARCKVLAAFRYSTASLSMLFNSFGFLFLFLPITLAGYQLAGRVGRRAVVIWLGLMSLVFYGVWRREFLWLLGGSIAFNFVCSRLIVRWREQERWAHAAMVGAVGRVTARCGDSRICAYRSHVRDWPR